MVFNGLNGEFFIKWNLKKESESENCSVVSNSLGSHGLLQARMLEWVAFPFSGGSSQLWDQTQVSHIAGKFLFFIFYFFNFILFLNFT